MRQLTNGIIDLKVDEHGAELHSIRKNGVEYLWQGDPTFWGRHSPVLFPIVGSLWNKKMHVEGRTYQMGQHGFARDMDFLLVSQEENSITYRLTSDGETHDKFPWEFQLDITYRLEGQKVIVIWEVTNTSAREMFFQIGAHPAFYYPGFRPESELKGWFTLSKNGKQIEDIDYILIGEKGCADIEKHYPLPLEKTDLPGLGGLAQRLDQHSFDNDAFIIEGSQVDTVTLHSPEGQPWLRLHFDAPLVGLWSPCKNNAPFVCIEPWYGRCDRMGYTGEFKDRDHINRLAPENSFRCEYSIEVM